MSETASSLFRALLDLFLERSCPVCGCAMGRHERWLCLPCEADLPLTGYWRMPRNAMADRFNARLEDLPDAYVRAAALFFYRSEVGYAAIPKALKYHADFRLGRHFAAQLGQALKDSPLFRDVDAVIPVPLHPLRQLRRGYNQAEVLAKTVAEKLGATLRTDLLRRHHYTRSQTRISGGAGKSGNVANAFSLRPKAFQRARRRPCRHVLLLDDVFTTGSTLEACYRVLLPLFPPGKVRISVATLAVVKD